MLAKIGAKLKQFVSIKGKAMLKIFLDETKKFGVKLFNKTKVVLTNLAKMTKTFLKECATILAEALRKFIFNLQVYFKSLAIEYENLLKEYAKELLDNLTKEIKKDIEEIL